jgi:competence protein ComEC
MRFRRTTVITIGLLAFLGGLGFTRTGWLISYELVLSRGIFFLVTVLRLRLLAVISAVLFSFSLGWLRGQMYMPNVRALSHLDGVRAVATVRADSDTFYNNRGQLTFDASQLHLLEPEDQTLPGRLTISGYGEPAIFKGDLVQIEGKFYARRGSKQLGMSFAQFETIETRQSQVDTIRRRFSAGLATAVPEPQSSLGLGLLIGQRSTLPETVGLQLSVVGLTHIVAVSGYNLTIIMRAVKRLLNKRSKYQITALSLTLIALFLLMTGMSASIVRAAIVSGLSIVAWHYGRTFRPLLLISLAAVITAAYNPFYIWSDIGWYLSFLAFFGVLILAPLLQERIYKSKQPKILAAVCLESFSAMVMTLPLIMYIFKQISLVALPANLIIVPMVPLAMLASLVAGLAGMFAPVVSGLLAWPATVLLTAMLDIVQILSGVPHALAARSLSLVGMLAWYACLLFVTIILWRVRLRNDKITDMKRELPA